MPPVEPPVLLPEEPGDWFGMLLDPLAPLPLGSVLLSLGVAAC